MQQLVYVPSQHLVLPILPKLEKHDFKGGACFDVPDKSLVGIFKGIILADYSKTGEELGSKEDTPYGIYEWALVGIHEGAIFGTNVVKYE